jgi:hypothetical protein
VPHVPTPPAAPFNRTKQKGGKPPELIKRKRGRPKGSKNKPKDTNHSRNFRTRKLGHTAPRCRGQAGIEGAP